MTCALPNPFMSTFSPYSEVEKIDITNAAPVCEDSRRPGASDLVEPPPIGSAGAAAPWDDAYGVGPAVTLGVPAMREANAEMAERIGAAAYSVDMRQLLSQIQTMDDWMAAQILAEECLERMEFEGIS